MIQIRSELADHLNQGGTLIVPTRQRAAAIRVAHTALQLQSGRSAWPSPDVLPWGAWLQRGLDAARARGMWVPRRLSAGEEWLLWREAVRAACSDLPVVWPDALIDVVRRGVELLEDYGLNLQVSEAAETAVLLQAQAHVRRRCDELGVLRASSWRDCEPYVRVATPSMMVGFMNLGPARGAWLEQLGIGLSGAVDDEWTPAAPHVESALGCEDPDQEAQAAAHWCASRLARDPAARLLVVVLPLAKQRHRWVRALAQRLDCAAILEPAPGQIDSVFAIEGGVPLAAYPLIDCALKLITLHCGEGDFQALSSVLRSPYLDPSERESRLRIDVWLRERNVDLAERVSMPVLAGPIGSALGERAATSLETLIAALEPAGPATGARWAERYAALLERCGWPGASLGSAEQQVRIRFQELLGEFAALALASQALQGAEAAELLQQLAGRVAFEPASDDVPVTLTSSIDDPIVHYDGIWVAGLSAEAWPPAAQPDPLIPIPIQRAAGMRSSSAAGQLHLAEDALRRWRGACTELRCSWSRSDEDLRHDPSPLLEVCAADTAEHENEVADPLRPVELESWLVAQAPPLEAWTDVQGPAWLQPMLPGGTRLLELQSQCPFRGFAELRLSARALPEPTPGIDPRLRGRILHRALELFWRATHDSATLRERGFDANLETLRVAIAQALAEGAAGVAGTLEPTMLRAEGERAERVLWHLLAWELGREPFRIEHLEWAQIWTIEEATLRLRLDRVDRLDDGSLAVIDYKSGAPRAFDAMLERPEQPQLLAYALTAGDATAAVLAAYLGRDGLKLRGIADRADRLPGLRQAAEGAAMGPALLQSWQAQLQHLAHEFLAGYAAVDPIGGACEHCHLQALCRVDPALLRQS